MARKITDDQIAEALNPALSETTVQLADQTIRVVTMSLAVEQVFLKKLRKIVPTTISGLSGPELIDALIDTDVNILCELAAMVAKNSERIANRLQLLICWYLRGWWILSEPIEAQIEKQGYLDFLLRIAAALPGVLTAKQ